MHETLDYHSKLNEGLTKDLTLELIYEFYLASRVRTEPK